MFHGYGVRFHQKMVAIIYKMRSDHVTNGMLFTFQFNLLEIERWLLNLTLTHSLFLLQKSQKYFNPRCGASVFACGHTHTPIHFDRRPILYHKIQNYISPNYVFRLNAFTRPISFYFASFIFLFFSFLFFLLFTGRGITRSSSVPNFNFIEFLQLTE